MPAAAVLKIETSTLEDDCAVLALARYLGLPYLEVLQTACLLTRQPLNGLTTKQMKAVALTLGTRLKVVRTFDPNTTYGIVLLEDHCAVLWNGLVFEYDATVLKWEVWLPLHLTVNKKGIPERPSLLVEAKTPAR